VEELCGKRAGSSFFRFHPFFPAILGSCLEFIPDFSKE